jgi:hypothetical protein
MQYLSIFLHQRIRISPKLHVRVSPTQKNYFDLILMLRLNTARVHLRNGREVNTWKLFLESVLINFDRSFANGGSMQSNSKFTEE